MKKKTKCYIYIRVSTTMQVDAHGIHPNFHKQSLPDLL